MPGSLVVVAQSFHMIIADRVQTQKWEKLVTEISHAQPGDHQLLVKAHLGKSFAALAVNVLWCLHLIINIRYVPTVVRCKILFRPRPSLPDELLDFACRIHHRSLIWQHCIGYKHGRQRIHVRGCLKIRPILKKQISGIRMTMPAAARCLR